MKENVWHMSVLKGGHERHSERERGREREGEREKYIYREPERESERV